MLRELLHPARVPSFTGRYSLAHAELPPGVRSLAHRLSTSEVYYILSGTGRMRIDGWVGDVGVGDCFEIRPHAVQSIENIDSTTLQFLCIVDPAWSSDDETIVESR